MTTTATLPAPVAELVTRICRHCGEKVAQGTGGVSTCYGLDGIPVPDGHTPYEVKSAPRGSNA